MYSDVKIIMLLKLSKDIKPKDVDSFIDHFTLLFTSFTCQSASLHLLQDLL